MLLHPARLRHHCATIVVLVCGAMLLGGRSGHADSAPRPESFGGDATASSLHYLIDRKPQPTPVSDPFHVELPYATTAFDSSGTASATSASFYPGAGPLGVPALLCQFATQLCHAPFPAVPRYPADRLGVLPDPPGRQGRPLAGREGRRALHGLGPTSSRRTPTRTGSTPRRTSAASTSPSR